MEDSIVMNQGWCSWLARLDIPEACTSLLQRLVRHRGHEFRAVRAELHMDFGSEPCRRIRWTWFLETAATKSLAGLIASWLISSGKCITRADVDSALEIFN
jgi:hypothetical protein